VVSLIYGHGVCANCRQPLHLTSKPVWQHAEQRFCTTPEIKTWGADWAEPKTNQTFVGICGFAQSGKDTLANQLVEREGFFRTALADPMRNILYAINPTIERDGSGLARTVRLQQIVNTIGWERAKVEYPEIRQLLQRLGTDGARQFISDDVWIRATFDNVKHEKVVIPDVRFPNEAEAIKKRGGVIVRIFRSGYEPTNTHISETAYSDQDIVLYNDGTPEDLYKKYVEALTEWRGNN